MNTPNHRPRILDCHVHCIGNGSAGSGCWLRPRGIFWLTARYMVKHVGLNFGDLNGDLDNRYVQCLLGHLKDSSLDGMALLAHEEVYDERGEKLPPKHHASFYVPNSWVLRLGREYPYKFFPAVSIHPGRRDAIDELERCLEGGAAMLKLLPNVQNIDMMLPQYRPFWQRVADAKLPFLCHTGGEFSLPETVHDYANPERLVQALECGVTVIAAHSASSSGFGDPDWTDNLIRLMEKHPHLYADNSAMNSPLRGKYLRAGLREGLLRDRMIHGSDLPIPIDTKWSWLRGYITREDHRHAMESSSLLERDYRAKRAMKYPEATFTRLDSILRHPAPPHRKDPA